MPTQSFSGLPFDVANLSYERSVDDGRLDPPPGGWVDGLARWQEDVASTQANEWTGTFIMNNQSPHGDQTALYAQLNNSGNWGAAFVADAKNTGPGTTVGAEIDGTGHIAAGVNVISFSGSMDAAILIQPGQGGHVVNGIEITADHPIVIHGTGTMPLLMNTDTGTGIWQVNSAAQGQPADFHLVGVANMGTDHMHAGIIA